MIIKTIIIKKIFSEKFPFMDWLINSLKGTPNGIFGRKFQKTTVPPIDSNKTIIETILRLILKILSLTY